jgi:hypothetical protein
MRKVSEKKLKTHFCVQLISFRKSYRLWDNVGKYFRTCQATDNVTRLMRIVCWYLELQKHTQNMWRITLLLQQCYTKAPQWCVLRRLPSCGSTAQLVPRQPHCWNVYVTHKHTRTHRAGRTSLNDWSSRPKGHYLHHSKQTQHTETYSPTGILTCNPSSNEAAADLRLSQHGHMDCHISLTRNITNQFLPRSEQTPSSLLRSIT